MNNVILEVKDLKMHFPIKIKTKSFISEKKYVKAVDGVSFSIHEGETLGLVGESGCGKSTTGKMIVKLLEPTEGSIRFRGKDVFKTQGEESKLLRKEVQIIFQDPYSSLDPRFTVGRTISEPLVVHKIGDEKTRKERAIKLMNDVGLMGEYFDRYPHEFSGGQRQRIGVARALALNPSLIVCDEPVSALDVSIQAQILNLMQELQAKYHLTYLFISHNLSVVKHICDRIAVMYLGKIVEIANKKDLFDNPKHPYTQALLSAIPIPDPEIIVEQEMLEGDVPSPVDPPSGCRFHTRCKNVMDICKKQEPKDLNMGEDHIVACHLYDNKED
ncbi:MULTISPECIES: ABC transporter ATP-binding protein [Lutispora]|uniref:Dipeptide ABC transporter ATP-binding protein n=1 Tax=Lutispora saccharofermentans TaxID=3024236 RepID=A0ABT1NF43_9FIRM|nr:MULTISPECIES: dipeptide ABC transporter ATP-binding protein [Lutispora]MCQ1529234.1 dipeptide ABC transporter ATP-binding protein [Lutispora saccharofermentans]MEA4960898.1 dipeptide ABC transporter ATP-binding protein [Lutispora sp.]